MANLAPRGRDPEALRTRLWHGTRELHRARVFALVVSFHKVLRLIRKLIKGLRLDPGGEASLYKK